MNDTMNSIEVKSVPIVILICIATGCIQQEDLLRPPIPEFTDQCVTPLHICSSFIVKSDGISMASNASIIAVLHTTEGLYLFDCRGDVIWSSDSFGGLFPIIAEDGNYVITEIRRYTKEDPFFLVKLDSDGNIIWKREIGLIGVDGLAMTPDASFIVTGCVDQDKQGHVMLFDRDGNKLWDHQIDGRVETVAVSKSGHVVAGPRDRHIYLYGRDGEEILTYYAGNYSDSQDTAIAPDETYFLFGSKHKYLSCYTLEGDFLWREEVGPLCNVRISADGEYIAVGTSNSMLFLFDKNGNKLWGKKVTDAFYIEEVSISAHGEYVAANTQRGIFPPSLYLDVYSKEGKLLWRYEGSHSFMAIAMSDDGHYIAAGSSAFLLLFDNFQAIEEYKSSECVQSDTAHGSESEQKFPLLGQFNLISFLTIVLIIILAGILIIVYLSRRKMEKKA
jgi:outer membrane protein assembly factor BamB